MFAPVNQKPLSKSQVFIAKTLQKAKSMGFLSDKPKKSDEDDRRFYEAEARRIKAEAAMKRRQQEVEDFIREKEMLENARISTASTIGGRAKLRKKLVKKKTKNKK